MSSFQKHKLRKEIEMLQSKSGFHTGLISLYIPPKKRISDIVGYIKNEMVESDNIKSRLNRNNVNENLGFILN